jgi:hypothetical protein
MTAEITNRFVTAVIVFLTIVSVAQAKYGGGSGTADDPYQIATAADLLLLGDSPEDYDKHFILTADIDLDPNLPGQKVFDKAVIAPDTNDTTSLFDGTLFTGVFNGNGQTISHLTINGESNLGLFGRLGSGAEVKSLGVADVNVTGSGEYIAGLAGMNGDPLRGLSAGTVTRCYCTGAVNGGDDVGGLVGSNDWGCVTSSYNTAVVSGRWCVGGLVGSHRGRITDCYSTGAVSGAGCGGLVGYTTAQSVSVTCCFWDIQTSGQTTSAGGTGKTTAEMQTAKTFQGWGTCGNEGVWMIDEGKSYPSLWWESRPGEPIVLGSSLRDLLIGEGTEQSPYLIHTAEELNLLGLFPCDWDKHFNVMADIDLSPFDGNDGRPALNVIGDCYPWYSWVDDEFYLLGPCFTGVFDGNGHTVSHLTVNSHWGCCGLFSGLGPGGHVKDLGVIDVNVTPYYYYGPLGVGALVGFSSGGTLTNCYSTGTVSASLSVGGLVGLNSGTVTQCHSTATVSGGDDVGGLVGYNYGTVTRCYSTGAVGGVESAGGLVGYNSSGTVTHCYSTGTVGGSWCVGGVVGHNRYGHVANCYSTAGVTASYQVGGLVGVNGGTVTQSYSAGAVKGNRSPVGGLVGYKYEWSGPVTQCFWDTQTSGQAASAGGTGKTTAEMQTASTFLDAAWDFVGQSQNGTEDIWAICEGVDYPHLAWEFVIGDFDADADTDFDDFCILAEHWLAADGSFWCGQGCDLTNDGSVNWQDLMVFAERWLTGLAR